MKNPDDNSALAIAEMIVRLGRSTQDYTAGLSPAQWAALRYMARANRFSRTVSAFAEFHGTTRGTASQTVKSLVARGYVAKTRSGEDGRSAVLDLTDEGVAILTQDPWRQLKAAAEELPVGMRRQTANGLTRILGTLEVRKGVRAFGPCSDCAHLNHPVTRDDGTIEIACSLRNEVLDFAEMSRICVDFGTKRISVRG